MLSILVKFFNVIIPQYFSNEMSIDFEDEELEEKEFFQTKLKKSNAGDG